MKYLYLAQLGFETRNDDFLSCNTIEVADLFETDILCHPTIVLSSNFLTGLNELKFYDKAVKKIAKLGERSETKKCYDLLRNFMIFKLTNFL